VPVAGDKLPWRAARWSDRYRFFLHAGYRQNAKATALSSTANKNLAELG
jgi:hypothetical protein